MRSTFVGPDPKAKDLFHGVYKPVDKGLETEKQKLWESMSTVTIPDYREPDPKRGITVHKIDCPGNGFGSTCPVEGFYKNSERLARLEMEPLRTLLFQNPKMAVYNELEIAELVY